MRPTDLRHLLFLAAVVLAQPQPGRAQLKDGTPMPAERATRPDKMQPAPIPKAGTRAATPGTQTEDDVYVGVKRSAGDTRTPAVGGGSVKPLTPQGPLAAQPATGPVKPLTPQGPLTAPATAPRPTAGTAPNTGSTARTAPSDPFK